MVQSTAPRPLRRDGFEIAIICALRFEFDAVSSLFDEIYYGEAYGRALGDENHYTNGLMGQFNAVLVLLPGVGKSSAARAAASFRSSYNGIKLALIVGVCGGVPYTYEDREILLGDVVVSQQVIQYDFGRRLPDGFTRKTDQFDNLSRPNQDIRGFINNLQTRIHRQRLHDQTNRYLTSLVTDVKNLDEYGYPGISEDKLYEPTYRHKHHDPTACETCNRCIHALDPVCEQALVFSCSELHCDRSHLVPRKRLLSNQDWVQSHQQANDVPSLSPNIPLEKTIGYNPGVKEMEAPKVRNGISRNDNNIISFEDTQVQVPPPPPPGIHFGAIGSGDTVMKAAEIRDKISRQDNIIAFEMEGAGVWENLPSIVIKGVCDYADSHKNKKWQGFAAATAASTAKALIELYPRTDKAYTTPTETRDDVLGTSIPLAPKVNLNPVDPLRALEESCFRKPRNPRFTGRNKELDSITKYFSLNKNSSQRLPLRLAIHGLGGVGKTQLVAEYCHILREEQKEIPIIWFTASSLNKLESQYKMLGQLLDAYSQSPSAIETIQDIIRIHSQPGNEVGLVKAWIESYVSWVVVMDNLDDISFDVDQFIPSTGLGQVIFTSRNKRLVLGSGSPDSIKLNEPDFLEGAFLFLRLRSETDITFSEVEQHSEYPQIREIVQNLHGFPLALSQAAAYIRANDPFSCAEYLELLTAREGDDREFLLKYMPENSEYPLSVMTTWEISFDYLQKRDTSCVRLLQLLGFFAPSDIPIYTLRRVTEKAKWCFGTYAGYRSLTFEQLHELKFLGRQAWLRDRLGLLLSLSLISKDGVKQFSDLSRAQTTISMHPLVHEWIQLRLKPQPEEAAKFTNLCALILYQIYPLNRHVGFVESVSHTQRGSEIEPYRLQPHLVEVAENVSKYSNFAGSPPLELRTLLLAMLLGNLKDPWFDYTGKSELISRFEGSKRICSSCWTSEGEDDLASFQTTLFRAIKKLQAKSDLQAWYRVTTELQLWLSHPRKVSIQTPAMTVHLTAMISVIVAVMDWGLDRTTGLDRTWDFTLSARNEFPEPPVIRNGEDQANRSDIEVQEQYLKVLLDFLSFLKLGMQDDTAPEEIYFLIGIIKCRLGNVVSKQQYSNLSQQFFIQDLHSNVFKYMGTHLSATYFIHLFRLHTKNEFEIDILTKIISRYTEELSRWTEIKESQLLHEYHKYISSSDGRDGSISNHGMNDPLRYKMEEIWHAVIEAANAASRKVKGDDLEDALYREAPINRQNLTSSYHQMNAVEDMFEAILALESKVRDSFLPWDTSLLETKHLKTTSNKHVVLQDRTSAYHVSRLHSEVEDHLFNMIME